MTAEATWVRRAAFVSALVLVSRARGDDLTRVGPSGSPAPGTPVATVDEVAMARCGLADARLQDVASEVLEWKARGEPLPDPAWLTDALRRKGEGHPWPRVWSASGAPSDLSSTLVRLDEWLNGIGTAAYRRCGAAARQSPDRSWVLAVVAVDALADWTAAVPFRVRTGQWVTVQARLWAPAWGGEIVLMGPSGVPRKLLTSFDGQALRAPVAFDGPGEFLIQVTANLQEGGIRPVLEADIFADVAPGPQAADAFALKDDRSSDDIQGIDALGWTLNGLRASKGLGALRRDIDLDTLASQHAARMASEQLLAHDAGDGDPADRVRAVGLSVRLVGENVARAPSLRMAERLLWASPSHRANILGPRFDRVGLGMAGGRGDVWVVELFAGQ